MMGQRQREQRYPETVSACVSEQIRARLDVLAYQDGLALGIIVRRVLEAGLPLVEVSANGEVVGQEAMAEARAWWDALSRDERQAWQRRLPELKGRKQIAASWRQARVLDHPS